MSHIAPATPRSGERLVRVGAAVFGVGLVAVLAALAVFVSGRDAPLWLALGAVLLPVGLGVALLGLLRGVLAGRRRH